MEIRPIRTEDDYEAALEEMSRLVDDDPALGTPEGDRLDVLATLVQAYEAQLLCFRRNRNFSGRFIVVNRLWE